MTEKEKMLSQKLYDANNDQDLINERIKAKDLCFDFNNLRPSNTIKQQKILKTLIGEIKGNCLIMQPFGAIMVITLLLERTSLLTTI